MQTTLSLPAIDGRILSLLWLILPLILLDLALKGWGMWRAARMGKNIWFVALLLVNSLGILPIVFLLITKEEYGRLGEKNVG